MLNRAFTTCRAFTLLEIMIVAGIASVIMIISVGLLRTGLGTSSRSAAQGLIQDEARSAIDSIMRELKDSGEASTGWEVGTNPIPYTQFYDNDVSRIRFSRCVGYDAANDLKQWGPAVTYEHQAAAGQEAGKLVRTENGVATTVCDHVLVFTVRFAPNERLVIVSVTVAAADPENRDHTIVSECTDRVRLRN